MRIAKVKTFLVEGSKYNWTLLKIETDNGLHGWGEATNWPGSPLVEAACRHVGDCILGLDARQIDFIWTKLYRDMHWLGQAGPLLSAISAVDIALWDLKGKALGAPVYELLGGAYRRKVELYANYWFIDGGHEPREYARQARETVAQGFTALKLDPFAHVYYRYGENLSESLGLSEEQKARAVEIVRAVADAAGPGVAIAIETHAFLNAPTAVEMAQRLSQLNFKCMWYEEPAPPEFPDNIADIRAKIPLPVCVGERLHSRFMVRRVLEPALDRRADARRHTVRRHQRTPQNSQSRRDLQRADRPQPQRPAFDHRLGARGSDDSQFLPPGIHGQGRTLAGHVFVPSLAD